MPTPSAFLCDLPFLAVEFPKVTQIAITELINEQSSVTELQVTACVF